MRTQYTPDSINHLMNDEIFVFGSNLNGHHSSGNAKIAMENFNAEWGVGEGFQGHSYAIPESFTNVDDIRPYIERFLNAANVLHKYKFIVTNIGCDHASFTVGDIAPLFEPALSMDNVVLPKAFVDYLLPGQDNLEESFVIDFGNPHNNFASSRRIKEFVATNHSWLITPMSMQCVTIPINLLLKKKQIDRLRMGFIPKYSTDIYFLYCEGNQINIHRSWSGKCLFTATYESDKDGDVIIKNVTINRDDVECMKFDEENALANFLNIIATECEVPVKEFIDMVSPENKYGKKQSLYNKVLSMYKILLHKP